MVNKIRLTICGCLFLAASWMAPIKTRGGQITIEAVWDWTGKMVNLFVVKKEE